ncbi:MAG: dockerin type I domain-containing protein [Armatimonadota bacterium]|nr:dockerin type I domain-containing protein [Armatimonadota bacterium]
MVRYAIALGLVSAIVATTSAQVVLGDNKGKVRAVNALAADGQAEQPLDWSRRNFQDGTNLEAFGFYPGYTIQVNAVLFDVFGNNVGPGDDTATVTITTVDSLRAAPFNWPGTFTVPRSLFRQGGVYTNENGTDENRNGTNRDLYGTAWIKYELDDSNPNGWYVVEVQVFAWDVRDVLHKSSATKTRPFSDVQAPQRIDIYVAQNDPNPGDSPQTDPNWVLVGSLDKANGTLPNVCQWDPSTGNTFGECPTAFLEFLNGNNPLGIKFFQDPTNPIWYSRLRVRGRDNIKYVALVIPQGNQFNNDPELVSRDRVANSLRYTNFTDVRVIAGIPGDVNNDGVVNNADLLLVLFAFGQSGDNDADVNGDGVVNNADLLIVLFNFGRSR